MSFTTRRSFLFSISSVSVAAAVRNRTPLSAGSTGSANSGRLRFVLMDVFTSHGLEGNPLSVFPDARRLSDSQMEALARETNLQETTFIFPRDAETELQQGVKVRIYTTGGEVPFGGHPTLGTAMVLHAMRQNAAKSSTLPTSQPGEVVLDLKVGKVPVSFHQDENGVFGEMRQVPPFFGPVHARGTIADLLDLDANEIDADLPIQTMSTGLPFVIVPLKRLSTLERLHVAPAKAYRYLGQQPDPKPLDFYYITRDAGASRLGLRARAIYPEGEDPATGSAAGCTAAWMVKHGAAAADETVLIRQGVEIKRPSDIYVRASKSGSDVSDVRVGGHSVRIGEGEFSL